MLELKMALRDMRQILVYTQVLDIYICVPLVSPAADFKKGSRLTTYMGLSYIEYTYFYTDKMTVEKERVGNVSCSHIISVL